MNKLDTDETQTCRWCWDWIQPGGPMIVYGVRIELGMGEDYPLDCYHPECDHEMRLERAGVWLEKLLELSGPRRKEEI